MNTSGAAPWRGYWPSRTHPFSTDGSLDEDAWRALLALYAEHGVHGVLVNGTTGEWFSQTPEERLRVAEIAVAELSGQLPVVIGCGAYTAAESARYGEHARSIGADGILTTPPPYVHPSQDEIHAFYATLAGAVDLPLMVYNWPRGTAVDITVDTLVGLAELDTVVAVKDSSGDELKVADTCAALALQGPGLRPLHPPPGHGRHGRVRWRRKHRRRRPRRALRRPLLRGLLGR